MLVGTAMTGEATRPPTTLGSAPSMPATTTTTSRPSSTRAQAGRPGDARRGDGAAGDARQRPLHAGDDDDDVLLFEHRPLGEDAVEPRDPHVDDEFRPAAPRDDRVERLPRDRQSTSP